MFGFNDAVQINENAPVKYHPGEFGSIIADYDEPFPHQKDGILCWTVETSFGDVDVPEKYLILLEKMDWSPWTDGQTKAA